MKKKKETKKKDNISRKTKSEGGNLIPFNKGGSERERELQRKGGQASVIARRQKKNIKQYLKDILDMHPTEKEKVFLETNGLITPDGTTDTGDEINKGLVLAATIYREAIKGSPRFMSMAISMQEDIAQKEESTTTNIIEALKGSAEADWDGESIQPNENAKIIEEAIKGET